MRFWFLLLAFGLLCRAAIAAPVDPAQGADFGLLSPPQPVQVNERRVEVVEFFMFHCPHCYGLEPYLKSWVQQNQGRVHFRRIHVGRRGLDDVETHLFLTLEAMGIADEWYTKVFDAFHKEHRRIVREEEVVAWAQGAGLDKDAFLRHWKSSDVLSRLSAIPQLANAYKLKSVPTLVVAGKYVVSPDILLEKNPQLSEQELRISTIAVLDKLVNENFKSSAQ